MRFRAALTHLAVVGVTATGVAACAAPAPTARVTLGPGPTASPTLGSAPLPPGTGAVTGGIDFCAAVPQTPGYPAYMAGTVYVLRGTVSLTQSGSSELVALPSDEVTSAATGPSQPYRFILQPGQYVLEALLDGATPSPGLVGPYRAITVRAGVSMDAPIPNHCK